MKYIFILLCFLVFSRIELLAQVNPPNLGGGTKMNPEEPTLPTNEVISHIGTDVYIYDQVVDHKIVNDTLKIFYIGGKFPKQTVAILIKGKKANKQIIVNDDTYKYKSHFSGKAIMYKGKPAIIITNAVQLGTRIQI